MHMVALTEMQVLHDWNLGQSLPNHARVWQQKQRVTTSQESRSKEKVR